MPTGEVRRDGRDGETVSVMGQARVVCKFSLITMEFVDFVRVVSV